MLTLAARLSRRRRRLHGDHAGRPPGADRRRHRMALRREARVRLLDGGALHGLSLLLDPAHDPHRDGRGREARPRARGGGALARRLALAGDARRASLPALKPAIISAGAICFATAMGAFGTAFTLATHINVLPMMIYTEFTNYANFAMAAVAVASCWAIDHLGGARAGAHARRRDRRGGGMMAKRRRARFWLQLGVHARRLRVPDRAGRDVDPGRPHRELLRRREERPDAALGGRGVGALPRHHLPVDRHRARVPRRRRSRSAFRPPMCWPARRAAGRAGSRNCSCCRSRCRASRRRSALILTLRRAGAISARAGSSSSSATCSSRCPSWCARCSR